MDASTIDAARRGNREAQARLLTSLQDPWYRLSLSLLRDADLAHDATQETALRFLRELPNFRQQSQLQTWSFGIAINVARELRRKKQRAADIPEARMAMAGASAAPANEMASQSEERDLLRQHLATLPERQREAIVLRYLEELSIDEAAAAMDCAAGTVKATIHQALRSLRAKLKQLS